MLSRMRFELCNVRSRARKIAGEETIAMSAPVLFAHPAACSRVTISALEEIGGEYEIRWIDITSKKQYDAEYLALNRKAKVPTIVVDGTALTENAAILNYLHLAHPEARLLPSADTLFKAAQGLSDLVWCSGMLHPIVRQIRAPQKWTSPGSDTDGIRSDGIEKLSKECSHIDARLSQSEWWYGADWSIVDVYLYWVCSTAAKGGFPVGNYPAISAHAQRVRSRPSFQRTLAKEIAAVESEGIGIDPKTL